MSMIDLFKLASSDEIQKLISNFDAELSAIRHDRTGLKAAMPIVLKQFSDRLDAIEKKFDDGIAGMRAAQDAILLLLQQKEIGHVTDHDGSHYGGNGTQPQRRPYSLAWNNLKALSVPSPRSRKVL